MIAAVDVHYFNNGSARAAAVVFSDFFDLKEYRTYLKGIPEVKPYESGQFYRRELPCIVAILGIIEEDIDTIIIDGYVDLGEKPGLGRHLWNALECRKKIIGVAKKHFTESEAVKIYRGKSRQPLYITAAGIESAKAANLIANMSGKYRLPAILKHVDSLSRSATNILLNFNH